MLAPIRAVTVTAGVARQSDESFDQVIKMFQSSPLVAEGRVCMLLAETEGFEYVSILAPRCRGARRKVWRAAYRFAGFQSSPLVAEGRVQETEAVNHLVMEFQSSPLVAEGRVGRRNTRKDSVGGFNPRPSLPRGASVTFAICSDP